MAEAQEAVTRQRWRVLVAVLNSYRDFEIAREEGWYRIPLKRAPTRVGADYLAFYQTSVFGEERWAVNYYAPVRRYRIVSRRSLLPSEPNHPRADDLYYRIEIGSLRPLPRSIPSRRLRRVTFIPTTVERLFGAEEINDLWCGTRDEEQLWRAFKERGLAAERRYPLTEGDEQRTADFALFCRKGRVAVCVDTGSAIRNVKIVREHPLISEYEATALGWAILRLDSTDIAGPEAACLRTIMELAERLGGVATTPTSEAT
jgi:very-short-patch-repair endonuclease